MDDLDYYLLFKAMKILTDSKTGKIDGRRWPIKVPIVYGTTEDSQG